MGSKKCIFCKKTLIDEKIPVCPRCRRKGKDGAKGVGVFALTAGTFVVSKLRKK